MNSLCLMNINFKWKLVEIKVAILNNQQRSLTVSVSELFTIVYKTSHHEVYLTLALS